MLNSMPFVSVPSVAWLMDYHEPWHDWKEHMNSKRWMLIHSILIYLTPWFGSVMLSFFGQ